MRRVPLSTVKKASTNVNLYVPLCLAIGGRMSSITAPSTHETLNQCCFNIGPSSSTLAQHYSNIEPTSRVCWELQLGIDAIPMP